jgi:hypothetical protein
MNRFFWAFIACFQLTFGLAQTSGREERTAGNAAMLAESLTKGLKSDSLKVNAFFDWITANVQYDVSVFQPGNRINPELQRTSLVLQTGKAVCQGYANLFYDLCRHAGIPVEIIEGYCRYSPQNPEQLQLHAWNAVKVNGKWYMADLTWGTGYLDLGTGQYVQEANRAFFLAESGKLAKTHFPFDPLWQLSYHPQTKDEFLSPAKTVANQTGRHTFNYPDSLRDYEKQDSASRRLQAFRRMHAFDPANEEPKVRLAYHYNRLAINLMKEYTRIRSGLKTREQLAGQQNKLNQMLSQAENYYTYSLKFTEGISSKSFYYVNINDNRKIIHSNLALIKDERSFIRRSAVN